jgi:hypothetical protein
MAVGDLIPVLRLLDGPVASPLLAPLIEQLQRVAGIGLDYLSLDRVTDTLSGGEAQRIKLLRHLGSSLEDVIYILDEPSVGLHPRDVHRLTDLLVTLRDKGTPCWSLTMTPTSSGSPTTWWTWVRARARTVVRSCSRARSLTFATVQRAPGGTSIAARR